MEISERANEIVDEITNVVAEDTLVQYARNDNDSLDYYRATVEARMGKVSSADWYEACELIEKIYF